MPRPALRRFRSHEKIRFSRITPYLSIGTNLCCVLHSQFLKRLGVSVDIDLEYEHGERISGPPMDITLFLPTRDHHAPSQDKLAIGVAVMDHAVSATKRVYVHCKNGHGRAPTLVAAYLMAKGMGLEEAVALLTRKRPVVHLNREQLAALRKFRRYLGRYLGPRRSPRR